MHGIFGDKRLNFLLFQRLGFAWYRVGIDHLGHGPIRIEDRLLWFRLGLAGLRFERFFHRLHAFAFELFLQLARFLFEPLAFQFQATPFIGPRNLPLVVAFHQSRDESDSFANQEHRVDARHENEAGKIETGKKDQRTGPVKERLEQVAQPVTKLTTGAADVHPDGISLESPF